MNRYIEPEYKWIQLYAKLVDLTPTEGHQVRAVTLEELDDKDEFGKWHYTDWLEDFRENGIKKQMKVHANGLIGDGNFRYWGARDLEMEFVPIDPRFYMGMYIDQIRGMDYIHIPYGIMNWLKYPWSQQFHVVPNRPQMIPFPGRTGELIKRCEGKPCWVPREGWKFRLL